MVRRIRLRQNRALLAGVFLLFAFPAVPVAVAKAKAAVAETIDVHLRHEAQVAHLEAGVVRIGAGRERVAGDAEVGGVGAGRRVGQADIGRHARGVGAAHAGDDRRSTIEVYPRDLALYPAHGQGEARREEVSRHGPFHAAVATPLSIEEIEEIGRRYGCHTSLCQRGPFRVIEFWVDNTLMLEMLTPEMQAEYRGSITPEGWRAMLAKVWNMTPDGAPIEDAA